MMCDRVGDLSGRDHAVSQGIAQSHAPGAADRPGRVLFGEETVIDQETAGGEVRVEETDLDDSEPRGR
jgi:hypothetical protein